MTRVDFYLLRPGARQTREALVCELAAKAWRAGHAVFLQAESPERARSLDRLLWAFSDVAFVPHELQGGPLEASAPVLVGWDEPPAARAEVLLNLVHPVPGHFSRFERVLEVVDQDETLKAQARERWRFYQARGYALASHEVSGAHEPG